ncbi:MAG: phosphoribosylformylglycinamidine cyclo-ligase [Acidobacteriota bacterium]
MSDDRSNAYRDAGVDIDAQDRALHEIGDLVRGTATGGVLSQLGSFGGLFEPPVAGYSEPVLVSSADGVGTKLMVARRAGDFSTVGHDLVNHCVNDILVQGAEPLFFLDYVGAGVLEPEHVVDLVRGVADGCRENGCALLGGETAEMPGFYREGDYELVGFVVGIVDREHILDGSRVRPGDVLLGLPSNGLHTNGYSLARKILFDQLGLETEDPLPGATDDSTVGEALLAVHRSYLRPLRPLLGHPSLHVLAHITGGGLTDNLPRVLPSGCRAAIDVGAWTVPEVFRVLEREGEVSRREMLRVFNMGIGMVVVVPAAAAEPMTMALREQGEHAVRIGEVTEGEPGVEYRGLDDASR